MWIGRIEKLGPDINKGMETIIENRFRFLFDLLVEPTCQFDSTYLQRKDMKLTSILAMDGFDPTDEIKANCSLAYA